MCFSPFGIQDERTPYKCINTKCGRHFCDQCVKYIQIYNGNVRQFRCMYCLKEYRKNQVPIKDILLVKQLWNEAVVNYGIKRTRQLLSNECHATDLKFDIDCRQRHLSNLINIHNRYFDWTEFHETRVEAENVVDQLSKIVKYINEETNTQIDICKSVYQNSISTPDDNNDVGSNYIRLCERLLLEITNAEFHSIFPKTNAIFAEWMHEPGSDDKFQPKIFDLIKTIKQDLKDLWLSTPFKVRTKIGVVGYTSVGKSTLLNRFLNMNSLTENGATPTSTDKSTYFPLQFDREEPLIHPDNQDRKTAVTFVDIQGHDKSRSNGDSQKDTDRYLSELLKADCDIYVIVFDDELCDEQHNWIVGIEQVLKRKCILVRSKVDKYYLSKFVELSKVFYAQSTVEQRQQLDSTILQQIRLNNSVDNRFVYLVAPDYKPSTSDADLLLKNNSFDLILLLDELSRSAFNAHNSRIHSLAKRAVARVINICFRRDYVLNVLKYQIAAGIGSIIPFGDQYPRYLSREGIRDAFGIDDVLRQYLKQYKLEIAGYKLQTSVFKDCVKVQELETNWKSSAKMVGKAVGAAAGAGGAAAADDIVRTIAPISTALSGAARIAATAATFGIGIVISVGVCAWSAINSLQHIFSYVQRICDDLIQVIDPLIQVIILQLEEEVANNTVPIPENQSS
ncbi:unnamed protein product [Rotaria magnacalcarata]|uniref:G domain-containing protein n=1 Tax=Rotaria magnacalcarata TaxID=392030 RepID=A0A819K6E6_9BILA|nr:unnamed protein product [Rotaria magnacalcarata]CAF2071978.1 unnamed protein product [Rotaria magnacalcarata]CAF3926781.1 unnamed protein product [Rotaria magnacalcarata]CAF3940610.1 unnamed protein product [Rotaria magnacalcarata]